MTAATSPRRRKVERSNLWALCEGDLDNALRAHCIAATEKYRKALIRAGHMKEAK